MQLLNVKNPVLKQGIHYVTQDYLTREGSDHKGIDMIGKNKGIDDIIAIADGKVYNLGYTAKAGYFVELIHDNNLITRYLHLKKDSIKVKKDELVKKGQILGRMGNTGDSSGAHLHFAVFTLKRLPLDPLPYLLGTLTFHSAFRTFVRKVQASLKVKVDGIPNLETLNKTITISSKVNRRHEIVKYIQEYLFALGYTVIGLPDGIAGPNFTKAVKSFQKDNDCLVDGIITSRNKTWQKLLKLI